MIVTLDSQDPTTGPKQRIDKVLDFACGSGSLLLNVRHQMKRNGGRGIGKIYGQEKNITTYNLARMNMLLHGVKDSEFEIFHGDTLLNDWDILNEMNPAKKSNSMRSSLILRLVTVGSPKKSSLPIFDSTNTVLRPNRQPISHSCCMVSISSAKMGQWLLFCLTAYCSAEE